MTTETAKLSTAGALAWLSLKTWEAVGGLTFCMSEDGNVGLYIGDADAPLGTGDTAGEALDEAHRRYHESPGLERCVCAQLEHDGDALL